MNKHMNLFFLEVLIVGSVGGYMCSHLAGRGWVAGFIGFLISFFALFVGMILAFMRSKLKSQEALLKQEIEFQKKLQIIISKERQLCGQVSVNMAFAMSNKIANRVIAKYVDGLNDGGRRTAILSSVDKIIEDEFCMMKDEIMKGEENGKYTRQDS